MTQRRSRTRALEGLYILTDSEGFTTACYPTRECLFREAERLPLIAPITVIHWIRVGSGLRTEGERWKRASEWLWQGGLTVGP